MHRQIYSVYNFEIRKTKSLKRKHLIWHVMRNKGNEPVYMCISFVDNCVKE